MPNPLRQYKDRITRAMNRAIVSLEKSYDENPLFATRSAERFELIFRAEFDEGSVLSVHQYVNLHDRPLVALKIGYDGLELEILDHELRDQDEYMNALRDRLIKAYRIRKKAKDSDQLDVAVAEILLRHPYPRRVKVSQDDRQPPNR